MKNHNLIYFVLSLSLIPLAHAQERVVHIYNWADYIPADVLKDFEKDTGIRVEYATFDSNETLEAKLLAGNSGYDVVAPTDSPFLGRQIQAGVYQPLNKELLPNYKNLDKTLLDKLTHTDPGNTYAVPYLWGSIGIGYNVDKVKAVLGADAPVDSWALVLDPKNMEKLKSCGVAMLDTATFMMAIALNYLGKDPNSTNLDDYKSAVTVWENVRSSIRYFSNASLTSDLATGEVCVVVNWSGDVFQSQARAQEAKNGVNIAYSIPKEGTALGFDTFAIPKDAPHVKEAYEFINYMLRADVAAKASDELGYPNANAASYPLLDKTVATNPGIYPPQEIVNRLFPLYILPSNIERQRTRLWTSITSGQ